MWNRTPIAFLNLISQPARTLACVVGVAFALLLIFMQLGFRGAVSNTADLVYGRLAGDLVLRSPDYAHLYEPRTLDRNWLHLIEGHPSVERIDPFFITLQRWQNPAHHTKCGDAPPDGSYRTVGLMGMQLDRPVLQIPEILQQLDALKDPQAILVDRATRAEYGPKNCESFSDEDLDVRLELGGRAARIAGHFKLGTGLATNGAVLVSDVGYAMRSGIDTRQRVSLGLVRLKPGVNANQARDAIRAWLAERDPHAAMNLQVLTMEDQRLWERRRWMTETPIGMIFSLGVVLSFLIGSAIVYMILANDVSNRLPEYATLKAMGYSPGFLAKIVITQAWLLAALSYLPAVLASLLLYQITASLSSIPTTMTWYRILGVFGLALSMCTISGALAVLKLWKAEPASLF